MKLIDVIRLAIGNLRRNRLRTVLTVSGVVIGIGAIVFLVSLGFGLQILATQRIASMRALTLINVSPLEGGDTQLTQSNVEQFKKIENVAEVSPSHRISLLSTFDKFQASPMGYGIVPQYLAIEDFELEFGEFPDSKTDNIVVSPAVLNLEDSNQAKSKIGEKINLAFLISEKETDLKLKESDLIDNFVVSGILKEKSNKPIVLVNLKYLDKYQLKSYNNGIKVEAKSRDDVKGVQKIINEFGFKTDTPVKNEIEQINKIFLVVKIVLGGFGAIALFVASIGIFNTMTISLLERTHEIGIMKAIGATDKDVRRVFTTEAAAIGFLGGFLGLVSGFVFGILINLLVNYLAVTFKGAAYALFYTPPIFALAAVIFSFLVSVIAGIYPARRAAKLNPIEALRYE